MNKINKQNWMEKINCMDSGNKSIYDIQKKNVALLLKFKYNKFKQTN